MSRLARDVTELYHELDLDESMRLLGELTRYDRYQGSAGIAAAAELVARTAERIGLTEVEILRLPADGRTRWWTFTAPAAWTPRSASLAIAADPAADHIAEPSALIDYPAHPYALAAQSVTTNGEPRIAPLVNADDPDWPAGALVLLETAASLSPDLFARLRGERAAGFAVVTHPGRPGQVGRVELPPESGLFAFSIDPAQLATLRSAALRGRHAVVTIDAYTSPAFMPVVTARTATGGPQECLVTAHLCHPAPGANDNASGVVAALAVGRVLTRRPLRHAVRFVWGPEFVGLAAYLHTQLERGRAPRPLMGVNLDMVGQDQRECGGPLIIEHSPDYLPHFVNALTDAVVSALPQAARSYSGAVPCDVWTWRGTPYVGASDHSLLADRFTGCPAIQIGHWPDRYNHSSADSPDKVDPQELRRSAAIAASVLRVACGDDPAYADDLTRLVARWAANRMLACLPSPADPAGTGHHAQRLRNACRAGTGALFSLLDLGASVDTISARASWLTDLHAHLRTALGDTHESAAEHNRPDQDLPPLTRTWPGPFNLRALMSDCAPDDRAWLEREVAADRARFYATAMALAQGIDGNADTELVIDRATLESGLPIERVFGRRFLAAVVRAGWAAHGPPHTTEAPPATRTVSKEQAAQ